MHQGRGAEPIRAVVGEIRLAEDVQAGNVRHQVIVHPEATHGIMDCRIDHHWQLVRILTCDFLIHLEEVAVAGADGGFAKAFGGVAEIQIDTETSRSDAATFIAGFLGSTGGNVSRC